MATRVPTMAATATAGVAVAAVAVAAGAANWALAAGLCILLVVVLIAHILDLQQRLEAAERATDEAIANDIPRTDLTITPPSTRIGMGYGAGNAWPLTDIDAYLIDLDGTIYSPSGPIEGAAEFYASVLRHKPHVFLSNTGAKGADGVRTKLARNGIIMGPVSQAKHIYTAAQAQCRYMVDVIPAGARVFVIAGGNADGPGSYWMKLLRDQASDLVSTWCIRTHLTTAMASEWAAAAAAGQPVFVVLFSDGSISSVSDPTTGEAGFADWSYDVIKKSSFVLSHGASLIATAEDAFNPSTDNLPLPGPGMFVAMFRKLLHPLGEDRLHICGKGGREGAAYMLEHAIGMLQAQGFEGERSRILIVGDRFDTDIKAGALANIRTCLVESGCHSMALQRYFPDCPADFVAASIAELIPPKRRESAWRRISFDVCAATVPPQSSPRVRVQPPSSVLAASPARADRASAGRAEEVDSPSAFASPCGGKEGGASAAPTALQRQESDGSSASLRTWQLGRGNLVYSAHSGTMRGSIILVLRQWFDQHAAREVAAGDSFGRRSRERGSVSDASLPTISAADALEALRALGISPPMLDDGRPLHRFPFDVTEERSRVTFAQLCKEVQRALEATIGAGHTEAAYSVFDHRHSNAASAVVSAVARSSGDCSTPPLARQRSPLSPSSPFASPKSARVCEAPAVLQTTKTPSKASRLPATASEGASLQTLEQRWQSAAPPQGRRGPSSLLARALVDRRYIYLGGEGPRAS